MLFRSSSSWRTAAESEMGMESSLVERTWCGSRLGIVYYLVHNIFLARTSPFFAELLVLAESTSSLDGRARVVTTSSSGAYLVNGIFFQEHLGWYKIDAEVLCFQGKSVCIFVSDTFVENAEWCFGPKPSLCEERRGGTPIDRKSVV